MNKKLIAYRKMLNITQKQLADEINISSTSFCHKENGKKNFTQSEMIKITSYFKESIPTITMDEIFFKTDSGNLLSNLS